MSDHGGAPSAACLACVWQRCLRRTSGCAAGASTPAPSPASEPPALRQRVALPMRLALMPCPHGAQGGMDIVPVRLRNAVLRVVGRSRHRAYYLPPKEQPPAAGAPAHVSACIALPARSLWMPHMRTAVLKACGLRILGMRCINGKPLSRG